MLYYQVLYPDLEQFLKLSCATSLLWNPPFYPSSLETTTLFSIPVVLPFAECSLNEIMECIVGICLPSLRIRHLKCIHVVDCIIKSFFFVAEWYFIELLYFILFILQLKSIWVMMSFWKLNMTKYQFLMSNQCLFKMVVPLIKSGS